MYRGAMSSILSELLRQDPTVMANLTEEELENCFTLDYYFKNVDYIYNKVFGE